MAKKSDYNSDYMSRKQDAELEQMEKNLSALYADASKEVQRDFDKFTETFKKQQVQKQKELEEGKITDAEYQIWMQKQVLHTDMYKATISKLTDTMVKADKASMALINGKLPSVVAESYNFAQALGWASAKKSGLNMGTFQVYNARSVQSLMKGSKIMRDVDVPEDEKWNRDKINKAITTSLLKGDSISKTADALQAVANMDRNSAIRNARTCMTGAENLGRSEAVDDLKAKGIPVNFVWSCVHDARTRETHILLDGTIRDENGYFGADILDVPLRYPADPDGEPEEIYNCRCRASLELEGIDHSNDDDLYKQFMQEHDPDSYEAFKDKDAEKEQAFQAHKENAEQRLAERQVEKQAETSIVPDNLPASTIEVIGKKGNPITPETLAETVNPNFPNAGYTDNCQRCVVGYELGRRGYDVEAMAFDGSYLTTQSVFDISTQFRSGENFGTYITGEKYNPRFAQEKYPFTQSPKTTANSIVRAMTDWGDGARATLEISWRRGGAHIVNVENTKGKVRIIDAQSGMIFDNIEGYLSKTKCAETELRRTDILKIRDNIPPNILERICKKRK